MLMNHKETLKNGANNQSDMFFFYVFQSAEKIFYDSTKDAIFKNEVRFSNF